jgi:hypothetical protein
MSNAGSVSEPSQPDAPAHTAKFDQRKIAAFLLCFAACMLALHWSHPRADSPWQVGPIHARNWSGDLYTDEGWETNGAAEAVLTGRWYRPGDFNLAVDAPMWSLLLYLPFKVFGVGMGVARIIASGFYSGTVLVIFLFIRRIETPLNAALVAAILSVNFLGFTFGRLALTEPVFVFFIATSFLVAKDAAQSDSRTRSFAAGLILSLGILTKLTAAFAIVPMLVILWIFDHKKTGYPRRMFAAITGAALLPAIHRAVLLSRYKQDHMVYTAINITGRSVPNPWIWFHHLMHMILALYYVGPFLYASVFIGAFLTLPFGRLHRDALTKICLVWILSNIAILSTVTYFPPRYCLSFLAPFSILAVKFAAKVGEANKWSGRVLYALIVASLILNTTELLKNVVTPRYSLLTLADTARRVANDAADRPMMMGNFANTLSLYNAVPSINGDLGTAPMWQRIEAGQPSVYVTLGPATPDQEEAFERANRFLAVAARLNVLGNYYDTYPVYVYRVFRNETGSSNGR